MATIAALLKKGGIEAIVAAWRQTPAVTLLELAERYEQANPGTAFDGDTADFRKQAARATAAERGPLLRALVGPKSHDTLARIEAVATWEPDPRTSRAIEQLLRDVPYTSDGTRPVWTAVFALLARLKDPRFVPMRQSLVAGWKFRENHRRWMTAALERATEGIPDEVPQLDDGDEAAARALSAKLTPAAKAPADRNEEGLLADVYANPADDGPRLVYADWLQERGDPRGELIALQCAATRDEKRVAALLKAHGAKWLGPLAAVTLKGTAFRRGFPAVATARFRHQKDVEAHGGSPAWATIEELSWSAGTSANASERWQQFVPPAIRPKKISVATEGARQLLALDRPWELEELTARVSDVDVQRALAESARFPKVTRLTVSASTPVPLVAKGWMGRVKHLVIDRTQAPLLPWLAGLQPTGIERLTFTFAFLGDLTFTRGADGQFSDAVLAPETRAQPGHVQHHLSLIPDGWLTSLDLARFDGAELLKQARKAKRRVAGKALPVPSEPVGADPAVQRPLALGWVGKRLCLAEMNRILVLDAEAVPLASHPINAASAAAFSPDGRRVALAAHKTLELRNPATGAIETSFAIDANPRGLQFDAAGKQLLVVCGGSVTVHALPSGAELRALNFGTHPNRPTFGAFSPDGGTIVVTLYNDHANTWPPGAKRAAEKHRHGSFVNQALFVGPSRFVTSCRDGKVRLFEVGAKEARVTRPIVESPLLALSPNGKVLLASGGTKTRLLDPGTLEETGSIDAVLSTPAFSPDGKRVAGVAEGRVAVFDLP